MIRVKICGIQDETAALAAAEAGADAVGLIFAPGRRQVDLAQARRIGAALPPFVTKVGVVVNEPLERVRALIDGVRLDVVQLHGDEDAAYCRAARDLGVTVIKAVQVAGPPDVDSLRSLPVAAVLLDTYRPGIRGGSGETFDWSLAAPLAGAMRVILSGGLSPENVAAGVAVVRPYGVDVSSGVEIDGRKDPAKIRAFVAAARAADTRFSEVHR
jgi:phosphoribosylanthranilate isomerase